MNNNYKIQISLRMSLKTKVNQISDLPRRVLSSAATGCREYFSGMALPSGRPRWLIRTTDLAPLSRQCLMLGMAALTLQKVCAWGGGCVNIKCLVQTSFHQEKAWHFGKKYKFYQTVPLVVSDLLVLHWNIKIHPEKRETAWMKCCDSINK